VEGRVPVRLIKARKKIKAIVAIMPTLASQADKRVMTRYFGEAFQLFLLIALVAQKPLGTRRIERKITTAMCPSRLILESNKINKTEVRSVTITVMIASIRRLTRSRQTCLFPLGLQGAAAYFAPPGHRF
jgi:hypothetical protein